MKGLAIRVMAAIALLLWAWDMSFPWQKTMRAEQNHYMQIQNDKVLRVGVINHPLGYFVGVEGHSGIEYDLATAFANYLNVSLNITSFDTSAALFNALKNNEIDIAAAGLLYQPEQAKQFQIGASYYSTSWQIVYKKGTQRPYKIDDLNAELLVSSSSSVLPLLQQLQATHPQLRWKTTDKFTQEELLIQVAEGKIPYTVAVSVDISAAQHIKPEIAVGFDLTDEAPVVWYLQNSAYSELQAAVLEFMNQANENSTISRIEEKYFNHLSNFDYVDTASYLRAIENTLPKYQPLFEKYQGELEWQMLAAIAYQESHWDPSATSPTGVRGIMMLTRNTAERMNVQDRTNPEQSIKAGADYLHLLINQLPNSIVPEDRIWFALAAYNMGLGHLIDVRRLTKQLGGNPDNWLDVKKNLPLLAEKRYYNSLKYGYARGFEAFNYVENIRRYYHSIINYQRIKERALEKEEQPQEL
ncbi:lytic transglycosylase F [Vespertiliibacter pulmonis]|uniref:Membrane-bound lytic murein transglycosylase F n=1 Tax=Vespertiliibacter pulmonis TaxID=1443036 RepID=A0A3N4VUK8_9PAST|nr:membrane-bound lytic murein transglycosylase MltF [Vespertiliibacter pulmonis]QLB20493.1 lytic transglycosylase F [Vespertiliibacter pulmonis]RPE80797.1 membrane-bound lytic murein transglycosylase F [Vespertiliibacter pulmonis]